MYNERRSIMALPAFIRKKEDTVYYSGKGEFLLFVPEVYFERKVAVIEGEFVELLGICNYAINENPGKTDLSKKIRTFYFPSRFITKPGLIEKRKNFSITADYTA